MLKQRCQLLRTTARRSQFQRSRSHRRASRRFTTLTCPSGQPSTATTATAHQSHCWPPELPPASKQPRANADTGCRRTRYRSHRPLSHTQPLLPQTGPSFRRYDIMRPQPAPSNDTKTTTSPAYFKSPAPAPKHPVHKRCPTCQQPDRQVRVGRRTIGVRLISRRIRQQLPMPWI